MTSKQWQAQVTWAEAHLARVIALGCAPSVVEGAQRLLAQAEAAMASA